MLRKRFVIGCINDMLKNTAKLVHSRHRSINNFLMNQIAALGASGFFDNKPEALKDIPSEIKTTDFVVILNRTHVINLTI